MQRSTFQAVVSGVLVALSGACSADERILGVSAPGAAARVVLTHAQAAGGHLYHEKITIDSATARWEVVTCTSSVAQSACNEQARRDGDVTAATLAFLFETAQSREFKNLRATYERPGDIVSPDGSWTSLTVTVGERTRTIGWERDAVLPDVLSRYECWIQSARGSLILCSS